MQPEPLFADTSTRTWSVSELSGEIQRLLTAAYPGEIWLQGELRNLRPSARGGVRNLFFDLAQPGAGLHGKPAATVRVVLWDEQRRAVNATLTAQGPAVKMAEGIEVRIRGRVQWWPKTGDVRFQMTGIDPVFTLGRLTEDRDRLIAELDAKGLLRANAAVPLPDLPVRLGLVTARGSAAEADVFRTLGASTFGFQVVAVDAVVQGMAAPASIRRAIDATISRGIDALLVVRGGGAKTDLACFDHPMLARAIATCPVPVITGIGHDIDRTVADEVAHHAAQTPTAAAAFVAGTVAMSMTALNRRWEQTAHAVRTRLAHERTGLGRRAERVTYTTRASLERARARCGERERTLRRLAVDAISDRREQLDHHERHVRALDPARLLARGWSITRRADGTVVRHAADVSTGEELVTRVADGAVRSTVTATETES